ncbi:MAG: hypothetical protein Q7K33_02880 [Candidatus Berkelbacteria bacterium]|nr:hypothetical protein [Candidatus Berkelbacteria bacterium]
MAIVSISIPSEINAKASDLAKKQRLSKSQVFAEALESYEIRKSWQELRVIGDKYAKLFGIETDDDVEKFFG